MDRQILYCKIISLIYFIFLLPFYSINYYVPDTFKYIDWAQSSLSAYNTYSSMFITIAEILVISPFIAHIIVLLLLSLSMYILMIFSIKFLQLHISQIISILLILSSGVWFYFYGKIFYDFPFAIISLVLSIYILSSSIRSNTKICIFFILLGFTLSWKLTYIFMIGGICSLAILNKFYCQLLFGIDGLRFNNLKILFTKRFIRLLIRYGSFALLGFLIGYFKIIKNPYQVFTHMFGIEQELTNYSAYLFSNLIVWDHISSVSVHLGNYFIPSAIIIFFIIPLFINNKLYLFFSLIINVVFYVFITYKSTGYLWHSFAMGVYLVLFGIFMLKESENLPKIRRNIVLILMTLAISMQLINNYGVYLPKQIGWHNTTQNSLVFLQNNAIDIVENLQKIRSELDEESNYMLDFRRDIFKNKQRVNILNEYIPRFTEKSKHPWNYDNKKYTVVIYLSLMENPNMKEVYRPVFFNRKSIITRIYNGYTIKVFQNKLK